MANKRIVVEFAGETGKLDAAFAKVKSTSSGLETAVKGIAGAAVFGGVTAGIHDAISAASNLNESLSKSNNVFGTSGMVIDNWAKGAATNIGLSRQAALEAASSFGNMFEQLGVGSGRAADMSQKIVGLAADFASFHNADITDVIAAQQSAFRGEYDALQRFLPTISAAAVEQEALKETGKRSTAQLNDQEKALAVNTLMFQGAGAAMGDFDRTAGGAANQQRIMTAEMDNLKTEIGQGLLPVFTDIVHFVANDAIPAFEQFFGLTKNPPKTTGFEGFSNKVKDTINDASGFVLQGIGGISHVFGLVSDEFDKSGDKAYQLAGRLHRTSGEVYADEQATASLTRMQDLASLTTKNLVGATDKMTVATAKSAKQLADEEKATTAAKDAKFALRSANLSLEESQHALTTAQDTYNKFLETGGIAADKVKSAQDALIATQKDVTAATKDVAAAQEAVNKALKPATPEEQAKAGRDVAAATDAVTTAQLDLTDAQDTYQKINLSATATDEEKTRAWLRANDAARTLADAQDRVKAATQAQSDTSAQGTTASQTYKDALTLLTEKQGLLKDANDKNTTAQGNLTTAQALGKDYAQRLWEVTDSLKQAQLDLDTKTWGAQKAQQALDGQLKITTVSVQNQWGNVNGLKASLDSLPTDVQIKINTFFGDPAGSVAAIGHDTGNIMAGMTASRAAASAGGGGGTTNVFNLNGVVDNAGAARAIAEMLRGEARRSGPLGLG